MTHYSSDEPVISKARRSANRLQNLKRTSTLAGEQDRTGTDTITAGLAGLRTLSLWDVVVMSVCVHELLINPKYNRDFILFS